MPDDGEGRCRLARPKFNFEKRQKELAKQKKHEHKRLLKQARKDAGATVADTAADANAPDAPSQSS